MSKYALPELLKRWQREQLTMEQVIGHILQHLVALPQQLAELQKQLPKPPAT
jgi:hypothetical protein